MRLREGYAFGLQQFINPPLCWLTSFRLNPAHNLLDQLTLLHVMVIGLLLCHRLILFRQGMIGEVMDFPYWILGRRLRDSVAVLFDIHAKYLGIISSVEKPVAASIRMDSLK